MQMKLKYGMSSKQPGYKLTPSRRSLGKSLARGKPKAIALKCWAHQVIRRYLLEFICQLLQKEVTEMCSDSFISCLRQAATSDLCSFKFTSLIHEMEKHAPVLNFTFKSMYIYQ